MGCKGWGDHWEPHGKHVSYTLLEQSVFLSNAAISLAAEENEVTVTHIRSITPGKCKQRQDKPSYLYHSSGILVGKNSCLL